MSTLSKEQTLLIFCSECEALLRFMQHPKIGDVVCCPECSTMLEVRETFPLTLDWHFEKPFRQKEPFYRQKLEEWKEENGVTYLFEWEWTEKKKPDEQDQWTQLLDEFMSDEFMSDENAFAYT